MRCEEFYLTASELYKYHTRKWFFMSRIFSGSMFSIIGMDAVVSSKKWLSAVCVNPNTDVACPTLLS